MYWQDIKIHCSEKSLTGNAQILAGSGNCTIILTAHWGCDVFDS